MEFIGNVTDGFGSYNEWENAALPDMNAAAGVVRITVLKSRKLLILVRVYSIVPFHQVEVLYTGDAKIGQIMKNTDLSWASFIPTLTYTQISHKLDEMSVNVERIRLKR